MQGFTLEDSEKTIQLKDVIDDLVEHKYTHDFASSEESNDWGLEFSPNSWEKAKIEHRYKKRFQKTFETLIDRVDNNSNSSGSCSGEDNLIKNANKKKRKY